MGAHGTAISAEAADIVMISPPLGAVLQEGLDAAVILNALRAR